MQITPQTYPNSDGTYTKCLRITEEFLVSCGSINELNRLINLAKKHLKEIALYDVQDVDVEKKLVRDPRPMRVSLIDPETGELPELNRTDIRNGTQFKLKFGQRALIAERFGMLPTPDVTITSVLVDEKTGMVEQFSAQSNIAMRYNHKGSTLVGFTIKDAYQFFTTAESYEEKDIKYTSTGKVKVVDENKPKPRKSNTQKSGGMSTVAEMVARRLEAARQSQLRKQEENNK